MNEERQVLNLSIDDILPNRFQPRIKFNEQAINELAESIKIHGVIQPIVVRKISDKYEIIAGERRYKASVLAGKTTIPAIVTSLDDKNSAEIALIENVQRQDLTPIEEAISYKKILDMGYISQSDLGDKLGKKQSTIANKLRLLNLNDEVQEALMENKISERHARSLLRLDDKKQVIMLNRIISERLTVRKTDEEIEKMLNESTDNDRQKEINKGESIMNNDVLKEFNIPTEPIMDETETILFEEKTKEEPQMVENNIVEPVSLQSEFSFNESVSNQSIEQINPGFMDIDKIQNEAEDIIKEPAPIADMDNLLKPEVELKPVMDEVSQPLPTEPVQVEQPVRMGKFFNMFNFNQPEKTEEFVEDIEEKQTNMDFGEPIYNSTNIFENQIKNESETNENNTIMNELESSPIVDSLEPIDLTQIEGVKEEVQLENPFGFPDPVKPLTLTDEDFTNNEVNAPVTINEPVERSYMMSDDVKFNEEGEIEVSLEKPIEKFVTADMKTVINTIRNCASTIEKFGYKIETDEIDLDDRYEVTFRIEKI